MLELLGTAAQGLGKAIGGGASILGGVIGNIASKGDRDKANEVMENIANDPILTQLPPDVSKPLILQQFKQAGVLTPEMEEAINLGPTAFEKVDINPAIKDAQMTALAQMQGVAKGGLRPEDRAAFNALRTQAAQAEQAKQAQIMQEMQARGLRSSGAELAQALSSAQNSGNQLAAAGDRIGSEASQRALQAIAQSGSMAGNVRQQEYGEQSDLAKARDIVNQFNTQSAAARQQRNVASQNAAQQYNLNLAQQIANANTQMTNAEAQRQADAQRQGFLDKLNQYQMRRGANVDLSKNYGQRAANTANLWAGIGSAAGNMLSANAAGNDPSKLFAKNADTPSNSTAGSNSSNNRADTDDSEARGG